MTTLSYKNPVHVEKTEQPSNEIIGHVDEIDLIPIKYPQDEKWVKVYL